MMNLPPIIRCDADVFDTYSNTWDVLALDESRGEDDVRLFTLASFTSHEDASTFADSHDDHYVIAIRPPTAITRTIHKWMVFMVNALTHADAPVERYRRY